MFIILLIFALEYLLYDFWIYSHALMNLFAIQV